MEELAGVVGTLLGSVAEQKKDEVITYVQEQTKQMIKDTIYEGPEEFFDTLPFRKKVREVDDDWVVHEHDNRGILSDKQMQKARANAWPEEQFETPHKYNWKKRNPVISPYHTNTNFDFVNALDSSKKSLSTKKKLRRRKKKNYKAR